MLDLSTPPRENTSPLRNPKQTLKTYKAHDDDVFDKSIKRVVNMFYHCAAVHSVETYSQDNGDRLEIVLYPGNNPEWLKPFEQELLEYAKEHYEYEDTKYVNVRN